MASPVPVGMDARISDLMAACQYGNWTDVDNIITFGGARFDWEDADGQNALHYACMGNNYEVALRIKTVANDFIYRSMVNRRSRLDETPLHIACRLGYPDLAGLVIDRRFTVVNSRGETPLHVACVQGHASLVRLLLREKHPDVNVKDYTGKFPLHVACSRGLTGIVRMLLQKHAHVNNSNNRGYYPIHLAVVNEHHKVLHLILRRSDLDINVTDNNGRTALHLACMQNNTETAQKLTTHGANPNILDESGATPLHIACTHGSSNIVELLLTAGAMVDIVNSHRETALFLACKNGNSEAVGLLLDHGAKLHVENAHSPVQTAVVEGHRHVLEILTHHLSEISFARGLSNTLLSCVVARLSDIVMAEKDET